MFQEFRVWGFRVLGFLGLRVEGFSVLGFRVNSQNPKVVGVVIFLPNESYEFSLCQAKGF
jgi:hypothetical protein